MSRRLRCRDRLVSHGVTMRVAIITESFPPDVNGVAHCVLRVAELLSSGGHHPLVIAPSRLRPSGTREPRTRSPWCACPRSRCPATRASGSGCPAGGSGPRSSGTGPSWCTWPAPWSWGRTAPPWPGGSACPWWRRLRGIHNSAARTLAPSTVTATGLLGHQIENVWLWGRGVDTRRFEPAKRSHEIRARLAPGGELIAGYVGRLAAEKRVDLLSGITALEGVRLVIVGAGPTEAALRRQMPGAVFLGERRGEELAAIYASLDVFVHSGPYETFGQTLQESAAA